jgi:hypothetical protein
VVKRTLAWRVLISGRSSSKIDAMDLVCPACGGSNEVIETYKVESIFGCRCGVFLQYRGPGEAPKVIRRNRPRFPESERPPKL